MVQQKIAGGNDIARIRYAFKRSKVRFNVLEALAERETTYCGEICRMTGYSARDIVGVIRGNGDYTAKLSFVELGLVNESKDEEDKRLTRYAISDYGRSVYDKIKVDLQE
ncbi:MAG: archaellum operon transcriptional activator EarA family protein [Candidatus Thermoplasmatota archaeon]|nr:archaellum operon transcriptional activator EarA family protein [Candidatus Thermoplasmatota archaeon]